MQSSEDENLQGSEEECFVSQLDCINEEAIALIENNDHQAAIALLQKAEKMLDVRNVAHHQFLANCGKPIDRNLIIVILYNEASVYQSLWDLEKCQKFMDGVIFNVEILVNEKPMVGQQVMEFQLIKMKRLSFLAKAYLQYCAVLSQLGQHEASLEVAKKSVKVLIDMFALSDQVCRSFGRVDSFHQKTKFQPTKEGQIVVEEVQFRQLVIQMAAKFLAQINHNLTLEVQDEKQQLLAAQRQVYFWKNNPENNEKHLREQLNVRMRANPNDLRSLLGVQNELEWIEQFNIGTIMHISPIQYNAFALQGELLYEFSKKILLEKVLYLSISYFTIATEMRFIEIDKNKAAKPEHYQNTRDFKLSYFRYHNYPSVLYHLKSIEIACKHIQCPSPYIDHLISSFYKHYNQTLEPIAEELSYISQADPEKPHKAYKSYSDHSGATDAQNFANEVEFLSNALIKQRRNPKKSEGEDADLLQRKKLSLEGLKHVLQSLQQKVVQNAVTSPHRSNRNESLSMTRKNVITRCETEVDKQNLKSLSIGQLKKLKQELECKKKPSALWNKSLNHLLSVGNKRRGFKQQEHDSACKTERSQEDNKKISKSYALVYPKMNTPASQPNSQSIISQTANSLIRPASEVPDDTNKQSSRVLKSPSSIKPKIIQVLRSPKSAKNQSYVNQINIINSNTLNINNGQNFITVKPDNKQYKSKSNYQQPAQSIQKRSPPLKPKLQSEASLHINMKMETIQMLLQSRGKHTTSKF